MTEFEKPVVRVVLTNKNNDVILGKRAKGIASDYYALIGGKPDGNSYEETAKVEVQQEIGIGIKNLTYWKDKAETVFNPEKRFHGYIYIAEAVGVPAPDNNEISGVIEVNRRNLYSNPIVPSHLELLEEFFGLR